MTTTHFSFPFSSAFGSGFSFVPSPGGVPLSSLNPTPPGDFANGIDQLIDPHTGDYVRTDNGEWAETADARTMVQLMIQLELGGSPFTPADGTTIGARLRDGDPVTPEEIRSETLRVLGTLQTDGILADLEVSVRDQDGQLLRDQAGRLLVRTSWRDLSSGTPIDLVLQPG